MAITRRVKKRRMKNVRTIPPTPCPECNGLLYTATHRALPGQGQPTRGPAAGDPGVCNYCGAMLIHQKDGSLRQLNAGDEARLRASSPRILEAVRARSAQVRRLYRRQTARQN